MDNVNLKHPNRAQIRGLGRSDIESLPVEAARGLRRRSNPTAKALVSAMALMPKYQEIVRKAQRRD